MSHRDDLSILRDKPFSEAVEKLEGLLNQRRRAFLIGAGCSKCAGLPLVSELMERVTQSERLNETSHEILSGIRAGFDGATQTSHIEDYLSELVDLLAIAERRANRGVSEAQVLVNGTPYAKDQLQTASDQIKQAIAETIRRDVTIDTHREFVRAVHKPLRVGKDTPIASVDYLVLNYDTLLEDALAVERIPFSDGIDGGATGWWNPDTFDREALEARVLKLHGSINWSRLNGEFYPRRIAPNLHIRGGQDKGILIWPATTKYRETQIDPFAQLAKRAREVMCPINGSQRVLVICGYAFGDAHINFEIHEALHKSSRDLTVVVFSGEHEPNGCLKRWNQSTHIRDQVLIFTKRGFFHGAHVESSRRDLPWWKFETVVRLLKGER